jgi:hypothetical protein
MPLMPLIKEPNICSTTISETAAVLLRFPMNKNWGPKNGPPETVFQREPTREKEIKDALKMEAERREAAVKNMDRLRALRLQRDDQSRVR